MNTLGNFKDFDMNKMLKALEPFKDLTYPVTITLICVVMLKSFGNRQKR